MRTVCNQNKIEVAEQHITIVGAVVHTFVFNHHRHDSYFSDHYIRSLLFLRTIPFPLNDSFLCL